MPPASAATSKPRVPKYRLHKASGLGYVVLNGQARYFGRADDPASEQRYHQLFAEWMAAGRQAAAAPEQLTIQELLARYWRVDATVAPYLSQAMARTPDPPRVARRE